MWKRFFFLWGKKDARESIIIRAGQPLFTQGVQVWLLIEGWA